MIQDQQDLCGKCQKFSLKQGEKFFNCTTAKHADLKYGMQVRVDSRACEAFIAK